jgi:haloacid dehalogenase superfamily, subfamily IA, variant 3 with third motif having DD or ED
MFLSIRIYDTIAAMKELKNKIKAVIFDMDGVLLDTESMCDRTWQAAGAELGLSGTDEAINECRGCNKADTRLILQKRYGEDFDVQGFMERTSQLFHVMEAEQGIPVMRGAVTALEYLSHKGYRLALASSTRGETVRRQMQNAGLLSWFETLTTGDMVEHSKPDPEIYRLACASLSLPPDECAAVEDSPNGVRSASGAGIRCVMVPDKIVPSEEIRRMAWRVCPSLEHLTDLF